MRMEVVLDALLALPDAQVVLTRVRPNLPVWQPTALLEGSLFSVRGMRDDSGAWVHVVAVHPQLDAAT
jgi:hypothetical protein